MGRLYIKQRKYILAYQLSAAKPVALLSASLVESWPNFGFQAEKRSLDYSIPVEFGFPGN